MPQVPASCVFASVMTERASGEQGMTRLPCVGHRLGRRDEATEALEEAKEVRPSKALHGLSECLQVHQRHMHQCKA